MYIYIYTYYGYISTVLLLMQAGEPRVRRRLAFPDQGAREPRPQTNHYHFFLLENVCFLLEKGLERPILLRAPLPTACLVTRLKLVVGNIYIYIYVFVQYIYV